MLRILIIDANHLFREGLANLLRCEPGIAAVMEAVCFQDAAAQLAGEQPDLVLVDGDAPEAEITAGIRQLCALLPGGQVAVLSSSQAPGLMLRAVRSGARGFLPKNSSLQKFMAAIRALERGEAVIPRAMIGYLLDALARSQQPPEQEHTSMLTPRELDVLVELGRGRSNRQIATLLCIAENTVKVHVHNILEKLNLRNRRQAATYARLQGIHSPLRVSAEPVGENGRIPLQLPARRKAPFTSDSRRG